MFTVSFIGRTNVGKSSILNALARKKIAITLDVAGTTKDYKEIVISLRGVNINLIDTGGYQKNANDIWKMTQSAINKSHLLVLVVNAHDGILPDDIICSKVARQKSSMLVVNKADKHIVKYDINQFYKLGFKNIIFTSCKNNTGLDLLVDFIYKSYQSYENQNKLNQTDHDLLQNHSTGENYTNSEENNHNTGENYTNPEENNHNTGENYTNSEENNHNTGENYTNPEENNDSTGENYTNHEENNHNTGENYTNPEENNHNTGENYTNPEENNHSSNNIIKIAIIGRPNSGKSTMLNSILQEERVLTSPIAGTTCDSIHTQFIYKKQTIELIDTAGIRRRSKEGEQIEIESVKMAMKSVKISDIVLIVIDASIALDKQDLSLCSMVAEEGKIPIIVFNKWDLIEEKEQFLQGVEEILLYKFSQISQVNCVFISAINSHQSYDSLFLSCIHLYNTANKIISTSKVNNILKKAESAHGIPKCSGRRVRIKYGTQISKLPQKFLIFFSQAPNDVPQQYLRYLRNVFADELRLGGVPIFIEPRKTDNPYNKIQSFSKKHNNISKNYKK